uniref:7TM_GPCR_Srx domain-containing protein n=1 Tax=Steinernema glaseri TaxID=37863 RepID=A0A1I7Z9Q2_9BILA
MKVFSDYPDKDRTEVSPVLLKTGGKVSLERTMAENDGCFSWNVYYSKTTHVSEDSQRRDRSTAKVARIQLENIVLCLLIPYSYKAYALIAEDDPAGAVRQRNGGVRVRERATRTWLCNEDGLHRRNDYVDAGFARDVVWHRQYLHRPHHVHLSQLLWSTVVDAHYRRSRC